MGWGNKSANLDVFDMAGGHSSMLVPPYVDGVATLLQKHIDAAMDRLRSSLRVDMRVVQREGAPATPTTDGAAAAAGAASDSDAGTASAAKSA